MYDFSKQTDTKQYLDKIIENMKGIKIKAVFSFDSPSWNTIPSGRNYMFSDKLFIMFENDMCLIICYPFINELEIEFRKITDDENEQYDNLMIKDFFNGSQDIYNIHLNVVEKNESVKLDYSDIKEITIKPVTEEYEKWLENGNIDFVPPTQETFDEITFIMSNGKSFTICAGQASDDGYIFVWSNDAKCKEIIYILVK